MPKRKLIFWSLTVALGGFLFGFDTAVISGAEGAIQRLWSLNEVQHGLAISVALFGTVAGAMFGGIPSDKYGRKNTLFAIAALYLVSAIGSALAPEWISFSVFRFIGGLGVGASSVTAPLYIAEISPANQRGRLVALFQFNVVFGILLAYFSNYLLQDAGENSWRWMLGVEAFPAAAFFGMLFLVPESPRWLVVRKNRIQEALAVLKISNPAGAEAELEEIRAHNAKEQAVKVKAPFFSAKYRLPIMLAVLLAFFNQVSGINALIYYAPRIFEMAGLGKSTALLSTAGVGLVNFLFTLLGLQLIDRFGRKTLIMIGAVGLTVALSLVGIAFATQSGEQFTPLYFFVYIAFFAFSQGAVIWVYISEVFPNEVRGSGQALGSLTHWVLAAIITFLVPSLINDTRSPMFIGGVFLFFALMMATMGLWAWRFMPETKGKTLEELQDILK